MQCAASGEAFRGKGAYGFTERMGRRAKPLWTGDCGARRVPQLTVYGRLARRPPPPR